jgi:predicted ester cyclase
MIEPKAQVYRMQHIHIFKAVNGEIVEHWANRNDLRAARQLGLRLTNSDISQAR